MPAGLRGDGQVLNYAPEQVTAMVLLRWWQRMEWTKGKALVSVVAALHLGGAYMLAFGADNQLFTQGTRPVFELFPRPVWTVWFLVAGLLAVSLLWRVTGTRQVCTWAAVIPAQFAWTGASVIAVQEGSGAAMTAVFLPALFAFTAVSALVMAQEFTSGKR